MIVREAYVAFPNWLIHRQSGCYPMKFKEKPPSLAHHGFEYGPNVLNKWAMILVEYGPTSIIFGTLNPIFVSISFYEYFLGPTHLDLSCIY